MPNLMSWLVFFEYVFDIIMLSSQHSLLANAITGLDPEGLFTGGGGGGGGALEPHASSEMRKQ